MISMNRIRAMEIVEHLFHEVNMKEYASLICFNKEIDEEEDDILEILWDVTDGFSYNPKKLLARIIFLESGENHDNE